MKFCTERRELWIQFVCKNVLNMSSLIQSPDSVFVDILWSCRRLVLFWLEHLTLSGGLMDPFVDAAQVSLTSLGTYFIMMWWFSLGCAKALLSLCYLYRLWYCHHWRNNEKRDLLTPNERCCSVNIKDKDVMLEVSLLHPLLHSLIISK